MSSTPIADHAFLSDRHSCALIDKAGSVEWLCFPRFDGPSVFGRLLDDDAGHWQVAPDGGVDRDPALRRAVAGAGDDVPHRGRRAGPHRRAGTGPGQRRAPARHRRPARAGAPARLHRRRRSTSRSTTGRGRSTG